MVHIEVSEASLRLRADGASYERGRAYFAEERVRKLTIEGAGARATVVGTRPYRVRLWATGSGLEGECSCPYGAEGMFCKHCVAVGLAWLETGGQAGGQASAPLGTSSRGQGVDDDELRAFLSTQDPAWLTDELLRAAESDPLLRARLEVAAGADARDVYDDSVLRERLERAIEIDDFVAYHDAHSYFHDVDEVLGEVEGLTGQGFADAAIELADYALELLEDSADLIDDSDGGLGGAIARAESVHRDACLAGDPDREVLAERLVERALASDHEVFLSALPDYAEVLGSAGMARYREMVEAAWNALPSREPNTWDFERFRITFLMERLAEYEGGADALVAVLARDISSSYDILRIAQTLTDDGRDAEALEWLQRGLTEFEPDSRLRRLAAECQRRAGRHDEALELLWANFADRPSLETYEELHAAAGDALASWRERALVLLREQPRIAAEPKAVAFGEPAGHSTLVEVLLWEGDTDAAWEAAQSGGCRRGLWLRLARERASDHPADAIPILQRAAERAIERKDRPAYHEAAKLLTEAYDCARRCDRDDTFRAYLQGVRAHHRPKRALREELDRARLPG